MIVPTKAHAMKADSCRGCESRNLFTIHDFSSQPLAGYYPTQPESRSAAKRYPLDLTQCGQCGLLQVVNMPPIEEVFHANYRYSSSTVPALVRHFIGFEQWLAALLPRRARVFEFGCNDGVLMERLRDLGFECAGIDASDNVAALARAKGLSVATGFLTVGYVRSAGLTAQFDVVTCSNVFAHIHELRATLDAVRELLRPNGLFCVEVHDGELLRSRNQFETIYHEHLTYFTERTLRSLLAANGFEFVRCDRTDMHGGGLRFLARKANGVEMRNAVAQDQGEELAGYDFIEPVIERCRHDLLELTAAYGELVGYGAAGRSQMFINFTRSEGTFSRVYDDSEFRQGRYIAGTDIPIVKFDAQHSKCVVILAWNYAEDISKRVRNHADKVVTLLPEMRFW